MESRQLQAESRMAAPRGPLAGPEGKHKPRKWGVDGVTCIGTASDGLPCDIMINTRINSNMLFK
jgi:hypothetical protein